MLLAGCGFVALIMNIGFSYFFCTSNQKVDLPGVNILRESYPVVPATHESEEVLEDQKQVAFKGTSMRTFSSGIQEQQRDDAVNTETISMANEGETPASCRSDRLLREKEETDSLSLRERGDSESFLQKTGHSPLDPLVASDRGGFRSSHLLTKSSLLEEEQKDPHLNAYFHDAGYGLSQNEKTSSHHTQSNMFLVSEEDKNQTTTGTVNHRQYQHRHNVDVALSELAVTPVMRHIFHDNGFRNAEPLVPAVRHVSVSRSASLESSPNLLSSSSSPASLLIPEGTGPTSFFSSTEHAAGGGAWALGAPGKARLSPSEVADATPLSGATRELGEEERTEEEAEGNHSVLFPSTSGGHGGEGGDLQQCHGSLYRHHFGTPPQYRSTAFRKDSGDQTIRPAESLGHISYPLSSFPSSGPPYLSLAPSVEDYRIFLYPNDAQEGYTPHQQHFIQSFPFAQHPMNHVFSAPFPVPTGVLGQAQDYSAHEETCNGTLLSTGSDIRPMTHTPEIGALCRLPADHLRMQSPRTQNPHHAHQQQYSNGIKALSNSNGGEFSHVSTAAAALNYSEGNENGSTGMYHVMGSHENRSNAIHLTTTQSGAATGTAGSQCSSSSCSSTISNIVPSSGGTLSSGEIKSKVRPVKKVSKDRVKELMGPAPSRRKSRAGRKPLSGVFGICRQDSRWVVSYRDDQERSRNRYFFFQSESDQWTQLLLAKRFLWKVVRMGRKLNPRDGEGLEEFVRNYESDGTSEFLGMERAATWSKEQQVQQQHGFSANSSPPSRAAHLVAVGSEDGKHLNPSLSSSTTRNVQGPSVASTSSSSGSCPSSATVSSLSRSLASSSSSTRSSSPTLYQNRHVSHNDLQQESQLHREPACSPKERETHQTVKSDEMGFTRYHDSEDIRTVDISRSSRSESSTVSLSEESDKSNETSRYVSETGPRLLSNISSSELSEDQQVPTDAGCSSSENTCDAVDGGNVSLLQRDSTHFVVGTGMGAIQRMVCRMENEKSARPSVETISTNALQLGQEEELETGASLSCSLSSPKNLIYSYAKGSTGGVAHWDSRTDIVSNHPDGRRKEGGSERPSSLYRRGKRTRTHFSSLSSSGNYSAVQPTSRRRLEGTSFHEMPGQRPDHRSISQPHQPLHQQHHNPLQRGASKAKLAAATAAHLRLVHSGAAFEDAEQQNDYTWGEERRSFFSGQGATASAIFVQAAAPASAPFAPARSSPFQFQQQQQHDVTRGIGCRGSPLLSPTPPAYIKEGDLINTAPLLFSYQRGVHFQHTTEEASARQHAVTPVTTAHACLQDAMQGGEVLHSLMLDQRSEQFYLEPNACITPDISSDVTNGVVLDSERSTDNNMFWKTSMAYKILSSVAPSSDIPTRGNASNAHILEIEKLHMERPPGPLGVILPNTGENHQQQEQVEGTPSSPPYEYLSSSRDIFESSGMSASMSVLQRGDILSPEELRTGMVAHQTHDYGVSETSANASSLSLVCSSSASACSGSYSRYPPSPLSSGRAEQSGTFQMQKNALSYVSKAEEQIKDADSGQHSEPSRKPENCEDRLVLRENQKAEGFHTKVSLPDDHDCFNSSGGLSQSGKPEKQGIVAPLVSSFIPPNSLGLKEHHCSLSHVLPLCENHGDGDIGDKHGNAPGATLPLPQPALPQNLEADASRTLLLSSSSSSSPKFPHSIKNKTEEASEPCADESNATVYQTLTGRFQHDEQTVQDAPNCSSVANGTMPIPHKQKRDDEQPQEDKGKVNTEGGDLREQRLFKERDPEVGTARTRHIVRAPFSCADQSANIIPTPCVPWGKTSVDASTFPTTTTANTRVEVGTTEELVSLHPQQHVHSSLSFTATTQRESGMPEEPHHSKSSKPLQVIKRISCVESSSQHTSRSDKEPQRLIPSDEAVPARHGDCFNAEETHLCRGGRQSTSIPTHLTPVVEKEDVSNTQHSAPPPASMMMMMPPSMTSVNHPHSSDGRADTHYVLSDCRLLSEGRTTQTAISSTESYPTSFTQGSSGMAMPSLSLGPFFANSTASVSRPNEISSQHPQHHSNFTQTHYVSSSTPYSPSFGAGTGYYYDFSNTAALVPTTAAESALFEAPEGASLALPSCVPTLQTNVNTLSQKSGSFSLSAGRSCSTHGTISRTGQGIVPLGPEYSSFYPLPASPHSAAGALPFAAVPPLPFTGLDILEPSLSTPAAQATIASYFLRDSATGAILTTNAPVSLQYDNNSNGSMSCVYLPAASSSSTGGSGTAAAAAAAAYVLEPLGASASLPGAFTPFIRTPRFPCLIVPRPAVDPGVSMTMRSRYRRTIRRRYGDGKLVRCYQFSKSQRALFSYKRRRPIPNSYTIYKKPGSLPVAMTQSSKTQQLCAAPLLSTAVGTVLESSALQPTALSAEQKTHLTKFSEMEEEVQPQHPSHNQVHLEPQSHPQPQQQQKQQQPKQKVPKQQLQEQRQQQSQKPPSACQHSLNRQDLEAHHSSDVHSGSSTPSHGQQGIGVSNAEWK